MSYGYIANKELDKLNFNTNNYSLNFESIIRFIINNYKKILLFILVFVIIYIVEHITQYNMLFYGLTSTIPGLSSNQPEKQIKPNTFKNKSKKDKNKR